MNDKKEMGWIYEQREKIKENNNENHISNQKDFKFLGHK